MKVAVIGGTGQLGKPLVAELAARSDEVRVLSRSAPRKLPDGASHRRVDLTTGEGLDEALAGVEVVVDASNSSPRKAAPVQVEGTKRLLHAGAGAGVRHHIGISIVGCDRVPIPYYKVKVEHERIIAAGGVPWSLLRASQFHTLIAWAYAQAGRLRVVPTGKARLQPIDPRLVAERLAGIAHAEPAGRLPDMAGPQVETLSDLASAWRRAGHRGASLRLPMIGRIGAPVREGALCDSDAAAGGRTFDEWLADA